MSIGNLLKNSATILDEVYRENFFAIDAVNMVLPDSTGAYTNSSILRLCSGGIDVNLELNDGSYITFTAQGDFIGFSPIEDTLDAKLGKFTVQVSGLASGMAQRFINTDFEGQSVQVCKVFLDYDTLQVIAQYVMFDGVIYNATIVEDDKTCTITIEVATLWSDFDRRSGRMTDNDSNWRFQRGISRDKCFQKSGSAGALQFQWGPK